MIHAATLEEIGSDGIAHDAISLTLRAKLSESNSRLWLSGASPVQRRNARWNERASANPRRSAISASGVPCRMSETATPRQI